MNFNSYNYFIKERNIERGLGDNIALICGNKTLTYNQFESFVNNEYEIFFKLLDESRVRCAILLKDSIISAVIYCGLLKYDVTPSFLNFAEDLNNVISILDIGNYDCFVTDKSKFSRVELEKIKNQTKIETLFIVDGENIELCFHNKTIDKLKKESSFILYSSGSTGLPKGVIHNQSDMLSASKVHADEILSLTSKDIVYSMSNINYTFAFVNAILATFYAGAASVLSYDTNAWQMIDNINKYHPTVICGVPAMYSMILELSDILDLDLSSVRVCMSAGEKMPTSLWKKWYTKYNIPIIEGYGSVEMIASAISNKSNDYLPGSSGKPTSKFTIVSKESGELQVTGETVSINYIGKPQNNSKTYSTGDLFKKDDGGNYWYTGRKDNIFKFNGIWLNPLEIEENIEKFSDIQSSLVINDNMNLVAFVITDKNYSFELFQKINIELKARLEHYKCPTKYVIVSDIPRNHNGKKIRKTISKDLWIDVIDF